MSKVLMFVVIALVVLAVAVFAMKDKIDLAPASAKVVQIKQTEANVFDNLMENKLNILNRRDKRGVDELMEILGRADNEN